MKRPSVPPTKEILENKFVLASRVTWSKVGVLKYILINLSFSLFAYPIKINHHKVVCLVLSKELLKPPGFSSRMSRVTWSKVGVLKYILIILSFNLFSYTIKINLQFGYRFGTSNTWSTLPPATLAFTNRFR